LYTFLEKKLDPSPELKRVLTVGVSVNTKAATLRFTTKLSG